MMYGQIALKLIIGLISLLTVTRLLGKKTLSEITPFDLIYTLVLGGILEESIYDKKVNVGHLLFAVVLWGIMIYLIESIVQKNDKVNKLLKGKASVLVFEGNLNLDEINKNHIEMEQLRSMMRKQNCFSLKKAKYVILEVDGSISVMEQAEESNELSYLVVDESRVQMNTLESIGTDEIWLMNRLKEAGHQSIDVIVYAEWTPKQGVYVKTYEQSKQKQILLED